jgi:Mg-chelatase subunit ChlD
VAISSGRILLQMEKAGLSFARFFRALRMGLGNRHNDPKVAEGLALFKGRFRQSSMSELLDRARKLREIFGDETDILDSFNQDGALSGDWEELAEASENLTNEEVQAAVRRVLEGGHKQGRKREEDRPGRTINVGGDEQFNLITEIRHQAHDPLRHAAYVGQVARPAAHMRRYLHQLGLGLEPQRFRMRGKHFDKTRLRAVVLRQDPRMLVARELRPLNDLFLGVLIDCSGSMSSGQNIEKAKLFATLLAEAARGNRGIDLRLWGFTDRVIYECGTAARPAVHDLYADDGNNDAAALWHAAEAARASRRRAKMLVMISDGSPTECSVAALRALVRRLTRDKFLCAQVAVAPLDEVCFPHHVLLEEDNQTECVRRFGAIVMRLVRQALRG